MKKKNFKSPAPSQPPRDKLVEKVMLKAGAYFHPADFFYHELWRDHLREIGFRVISVERLRHHPLWRIRLRATLAAQTFLLITRPMPKKNACATDPQVAQLKSEIQRLAKEMGKAIKSDCIGVCREGAYFRVAFLWPMGREGLLLKKEKSAAPFSFLIQPWLRRTRN
jgi:hypothetical protein